MSYFLFGTPEQDGGGRSATMRARPRCRTVWLGASMAGLPEDLAARHVQTICARLAPLLKEG